MKEREKFGSRLGFILVSAGCAIGIGNVWKFPYITGIYGGAAFILMYLVFLVALGLPIMVCEFTVGRGSRMGMGKALDTLEPKGTKWHRMKWISILGSFLLMMFYTMVGGWMLKYAFMEATGTFIGFGRQGGRGRVRRYADKSGHADVLGDCRHCYFVRCMRLWPAKGH